MTGTDIATRTLADDKATAELLAVSDLLPKQYRGKPANVLWAINYGRSLGLDPVTAMLSIHVIEGQPTLSAQAMAAMVRRAGHTLRTALTDDGATATATLIRHDDPDYEHTATWTMRRAEQAQLAGKGPWRQYPQAMLTARAISEVVRTAASDVLLGAAYTPEELGHTIEGEVL